MNGTTIVSPGVERAAVAAEALDDARARLGNDADGARGDEQHERRATTMSDDQASGHVLSLSLYSLTSAVAPRISTTCDPRARAR